LDDNRMGEIFAYIDSAGIELDPDPIRRGPKYLNTQVAECRNLMNNIQVFEREVARERLGYDRTLNRLESSYELQFNDLLANDPNVNQKTSVRDREATVKTRLKSLMSEIVDLKRKTTDLGHVETVIQSKLRELKDVNRDIRLQMRLIEDEIKLGNFWGDQSDSGQHHITNEEIDLDSLEPEGGAGVSDDQAAEDFEQEFLGTDNSQDFEDALDKIELTDPSKDSTVSHREIDYDDLLEGL